MAVRGVRATQTAVTARLHYSTRILHNSQYPIAPHFFTYHLRTGWALCRTHKNAQFERVSPHSPKAVLSDYLPVKTLPFTAETQGGISPEGHKGPWRLARLTSLSWMSLLHRSTGRRGKAGALCSNDHTAACRLCVILLSSTTPRGPSLHLLQHSGFVHVSCTAFCPSW